MVFRRKSVATLRSYAACTVGSGGGAGGSRPEPRSCSTEARREAMALGSRGDGSSDDDEATVDGRSSEATVEPPKETEERFERKDDAPSSWSRSSEGACGGSAANDARLNDEPRFSRGAGGSRVRRRAPPRERRRRRVLDGDLGCDFLLLVVVGS